MSKRITNGRGAFRELPDTSRIPSGWKLVEEKVSKPGAVESVKLIPEGEVKILNKESVIAELQELGIPYDGRRGVDDLNALLTEYYELNPKED